MTGFSNMTPLYQCFTCKKLITQDKVKFMIYVNNQFVLFVCSKECKKECYEVSLKTSKEVRNENK